jgi:hypothetical protein
MARCSFSASKPEAPLTSLEHLRWALAEQGEKHGCRLVQENIENLTYAYHAVNPGTSTETALVIWAGSQFQSAVPLIDEYCRRRRSEPPQIFDHPVMSLTGWCQPQSHRVLVFREQLERLALELTGRNCAKDVYQSVEIDRGYDFTMFSQQLRPAYKETLSGEVQKDLYQHMQTMYGSARQYSWCASLVEQTL